MVKAPDRERTRPVHRGPRPSNIEIRADDPALTGHAGLLLTGELAARTDPGSPAGPCHYAVRPFKVRRRGCSGGELLVALAEMITAGGDHLVHLDELREDQAGAELRAVSEVLAPTTAGQLMRRFNARQCQAAVAELGNIGEEVDRQLGLTTAGPVTLDLDSFDSQVYGRLKQGRRSTTEASAATTPSWRPGPSGVGSWPPSCGRATSTSTRRR